MRESSGWAGAIAAFAGGLRASQRQGKREKVKPTHGPQA